MEELNTQQQTPTRPVVSNEQHPPPPTSAATSSHTSSTPAGDVTPRTTRSTAISRSPPASAKPLLAGLVPSSPTPRHVQRSVTAPPSPIKPPRPLPRAKSGTDPPALEHVAKGRSASLSAAGAAKGSNRSHTTSTAQEETIKPVVKKREKAYLEKLKLYETKTKLYVIGCDDNETRFQVLKIDRVAPSRPAPGQTGVEEVDDHESLTITEDPTIYTRQQKDELIETLKAGNGGAIKMAPDPRRYRDDNWHPFFYGIVGFVRLSSSYRLVLVTHRHKVALIGGHYVYRSESTQLYPITPPASTTYGAEDVKSEAAFSSVHLSKNFYLSYTYDVTNTLQRNLLRGNSELPYNDKFAWNWHLLTPMRKALDPSSSWILPLVHGAIDQAKIEVFGRVVYITLLARRSRHFAGARYLRRGVNEEGWVANDVESEQIVSEELVTPFHVPVPISRRPSPAADGHPKRAMSPRYTSFVQIRGSIPFYWNQDLSKGTIKPDFYMALPDPYYAAGAQHFNQLFRDYGSPVIAINLIKQTDNRESSLVSHFRECVAYLNQFLPDPNKIDYIEYDHKALRKASKATANQILEDHAQDSVRKTRFFHSGPEAPRRLPLVVDPEQPEPRTVPLLQTGVVRTNCIDCVDRTNQGQIVIASAALGHQLHALGFLPDAHLEGASDTIALLEEMYTLHGDLLSVQYGGSNTVNTIASMKDKTGQQWWPEWKTQSRDKVEAIKRAYANRFDDEGKQVAIDFFLGVTAPSSGPPSFEYLPLPPRPSYQQWFDPSYLTRLDLPPDEIASLLQKTIDVECETAEATNGDPKNEVEWWKRYYRTSNWTTLAKFYPYKIESSVDKAPKHLSDDSQFSPFISRQPQVAPRVRTKPNSGGGLRSWVAQRHSARQSRAISTAQGVEDAASTTSSAVPVTAPPPLPTAPFAAPTAQLATALLAPVVRPEEAREYEAWTSQFRHLSLAAQDHLSEKDRLLYAQHASTIVTPAPLSEKDSALFASTVLLSRPPKGFKTEPSRV